MKNQKAILTDLHHPGLLSNTLLRCLAGSLLALLLHGAAWQAAAQGTYSLDFDFTIANGTAGSSLTNTTDNRGMAYNAVSNQLYVGNSSLSKINTFDGTSGAFIGNLSFSGLTAGNQKFEVDQIGVASDGIIYDCGLQLTLAAGSPFKLYRWNGWNDPAPVISYAGDASYGLSSVSKRIGDTMAVTGSGTNTLILCAFGTSTNYALFYTADGTNFTNTIIGVPGIPANSGNNCYGIAFYSSNSFLLKPDGSSLYLVQFPSPASLAGVQFTNGTLLGTAALSGNYMVIDYNATAGLLATHSAGTSTVTLWSLPSLSDLAQLAATNDVVDSFEGGNLTAAIALGGGPAKTNSIYVLETGNGVQVSTILYTNTAVPPTITTQPAGGTIYTNDSAFTFSVNVGGTTPFTYQWQFNTVSNAATATNINSATNATFTLNYLPVSASGWYNVLVSNAGGGPTSSVPAQLTVLQGLSSPTVTNIWTLAPGSRPYLGTSDYYSRGIAYDTNTGTVLISDEGTTNIYVLNATNGNDLFAFNPPGITEGTFPLNLVGVADDGIVYFGNLAITANVGEVYNLYTYSSVSSNATGAEAYSGDPGNGSGDRWGDTMAIRGAGTNTQILLGSYGQGYGPGTSVALLTTQDGVTFTALNIPVSGVPGGFASLGLSFGAGNTFWCKGGYNYDLRQVSFDPTGANAAVVLQDYSAPTQTPNDFTGLAVDATNNILIGTCFDDTPNDLQFYQLTATNAPLLFDQVFYATANANSQDNAAAVIKFPWAFGLDVNNGVVAMQYSVPSAGIGPYSVTVSHVGTTVVLSWPSVAGHTYNVLSSASVVPARSTWTTNASYAGTGGTLSYTNSALSGKSFYCIQGQ